MKDQQQYTVTDHAVIRYLERCVGLDCESARRYIESQCGEQVRKYGAGRFPIDDQFWAVAKNGVVTTIVPKKSTRRGVPKTLRKRRSKQ
jgi:hypothetical protein